MTALAWLLGLPRWAKIAGLAAVAALAFVGWLAIHDQNTIKEHEASISAEVAEKKTAADDASQKAVKTSQDAVEAGNERARDAAAGSDDKLKAALDALREGK